MENKDGLELSGAPLEVSSDSISDKANHTHDGIPSAEVGLTHTQDQRDMRRVGKTQQFRVWEASSFAPTLLTTIEELPDHLDYRIHNMRDGDMGDPVNVCISVQRRNSPSIVAKIIAQSEFSGSQRWWFSWPVLVAMLVLYRSTIRHSVPCRDGVDVCCIAVRAGGY